MKMNKIIDALGGLIVSALLICFTMLPWSTNAQTSGTITQAGWYRIARNGTTLGGTSGSRAAAHFIVMDKTSGQHQTVEFLAYINFNKMPSITVLNNSYYGGTKIPFPKVRILAPTATYGGSAIEVYVNPSGTGVESYLIEDNDQSIGWTALNWEQVSTGSGNSDGVPTGFTACVLDLKDLVTGYVTNTGQQTSFANGNFYTSGNILLGKTTQTNSLYKLDINGKARANEIVVNSTGADYVFDPSYELPTLSRVKDYIHKHHHLPGITPAADMKANGLSLGENQTKLLQKIEELTLYLLAQEDRIAAQGNQIKTLKDQQQAMHKQNLQLETLEQRLQKLETVQRNLETTISKNRDI